MAENDMFNNNNNGNRMGQSAPTAPEGGMTMAPGMVPGTGTGMGTGMGTDNSPTARPPAVPPRPIPPANTPMAPLPPIVGEPALPAPELGPSITPPIFTPGIGGGTTIIPLPGYVPSTPSFPGGNRPCPTCPIYPSFPAPPSYQNYGQVRFLNASTNSFPVNISIDNTNYAINSRFGTITNYDWISDGFHTVTVRRATGIRTILLQQTFPFAAGEKVTMVLVDSGSGGLNLIRVSDTGCNNMPYNAGCYRIANMSYSGSSYDLMLYGDQTVFRNVGFQEVTPYKQAMAGSYQFYLTNSGNYAFAREIPIIIVGTYPSGNMTSQPLVSFQVDIAAGKKYTSYIIGNTWSDNSRRVLTVED